MQPIQGPIRNEMQGTLAFFLPRPMITSEFRDVFALWLEGRRQFLEAGHGRVGALFHHGMDGRPLPGLSPYRFVADGHWGCIHALGKDAVALLRSIARCAAQAPLPACLSTPQWEDRNVGFVAGVPGTYEVTDLVVCQSARQFQCWSKAPEAEKLQHVQDLLKRGFERQLQLLKLDAPLPELQLQHVGQERTMPKLRHAVSKAYVRVACARFSLEASLHGHWAIGSLASRGFGSVYRQGSKERL